MSTEIRFERFKPHSPDLTSDTVLQSLDYDGIDAMELMDAIGSLSDRLEHV